MTLLDDRAPSGFTSPLARQAPLSVPFRVPVGRASLPVRPARPSDLPALALMLSRCTAATRLAALGRGGSSWTLPQMEAWLKVPGHLVVVSGPGRICAVAALDAGGCGDATAFVLVEDAWQGHGLGSALLRHLAACSTLLGRRVLVAPGHVDRRRARALLGALGRVWPTPCKHAPAGRSSCVRVVPPRDVVRHWGPGEDLVLG